MERHLEILEDVTVGHALARNINLEAIYKILEDGDSLSVPVLERILAVCEHYLKADMRHAVFCINIITKIVKRYKLDLPASKLAQSAEAVLHLILTTAALNKAESLQTLSFQTLLEFSDDIIVEIAFKCDDVYELFNLYCQTKTAVEVRFQPVYLTLKVLNKLTPDKKTVFVKKGLAVWFSRLVPCAMNYFQTDNAATTPLAYTILELLELLTIELATIDYAANPQWQNVLENIYSPTAYPAQMKALLMEGFVIWHRIWIIFIKLLKAQITMNKPGVGSPINSMLPVVEMAFKMDVKNRCKAFQCWKVLIDNFSAETNELFVNKRIKLLIIPLRSNNAKVEETALAKLDTWWHLIKQYEGRVDDRMLYPFLLFCFGKHVPDKALVPGLISPIVKKNCVEVFVEMVGHVRCEGCTSKAKLKGKLISTKALVDHWSDWLHSLKMVVKLSTEDDVGVERQQINCAWKSFAMTIAELPENNLRKDLFNDLLIVISELAVESSSNAVDVVNDVLICSLLEKSTLKQLLKTKEFLNGPVHLLISVLINPAFVETCKKHNIDSSIKKNLKLITDFVVTESTLRDQLVEWLIMDGPVDDYTLQLWTALTEALQAPKSTQERLHQMCNLLLWPLKNLQHFSDVNEAALTWNKTYCTTQLLKVKTMWFHAEIIEILSTNKLSYPAATFFVLCVLLKVIKTNVVTKSYKELNKEVKLFRDVMSKFNSYKEIESVFPMLIDTFDLLSSTATDESAISECILDIASIGKDILNLFIKQLQHGETTDEVIVVIELLFTTDIGNEIKIRLLDDLLKLRSLFTTIPVPSKLDSILKAIMLDKGIDKSLRAKIKAVYEKSESQPKNVVGTPKNKELKTKEQVENNFTTPVTKSAKKNTKNKEASIVNTVVENGEEFAVIKSNWKFNPRKLTENQKEKFQRKREDIPALYQDLSQSQDEFKLKSWKTDSQDASTTNSRSASTPSNDNISTIMDMPGTDIVPKIIDNFFSQSPKNDNTEKTTNKESDTPKLTTDDKAKSSPSAKTPRMALKDRVFRNVRNLIEKSSVSNEGPQKSDLNQTVNTNTFSTPDNKPKEIKSVVNSGPQKSDLNQTVNTNTFSTPDNKPKEIESVVNSAPSKISADRPARVKRKPKKFDDTELFLNKKRRNSTNQNVSQSMEITDTTEEVTSVSKNNNEDINESLKVATVSVENLEIVNGEVSKPNDSTEPEPVSDDNIKEGGTSEKLMVAEVSSSSTGDIVSKNVDDSSNVNPEGKPHDDCSSSNISADKSIEETQQAEQLKETEDNNTSTPNPNTKRKDSGAVKSTKKKKSRIESELAIDMVEGHPFLKLQSDKRLTRKCLANTPNSTRRKSLADKLNKSKTEPKSTSKPKKDTINKDSTDEKSNKDSKNSKDLSVTVCETQDISPDATQDLSEDVIESSQDTTTTISVKSIRGCTNKQSSSTESIEKSVLETQNLIDTPNQDINSTADAVMIQENKDDTDIPANKTDVQVSVTLDLTEEMDTEPLSSGDVIIINDEDPVIDLDTNNECDPGPGPDTLELANADTQPTDPSLFANNIDVLNTTSQKDIADSKENIVEKEPSVDDSQLPSTADDTTITLVDITQNEEAGASSPCKGDGQRKKDFLNNTSEISPIKSLSPIEPTSPSPETSSDFLVIKLTGPLQMNGEPFEMSNSPEIFTEERVSPDKRDQSPPRPEVTASNCSPSSSLSLKKNRPQVRSGGRAAQMLGLCVPDRLQTIMHVDRPETEEPKKSSPLNTPARRNLRMLYQTAVDSESSDGKEETENFLKFKKTLPTADSSPAGPILKRKLADIADEATVSPANKRKRVSFHDPVSTSVSVQKYIETSGVRSPQNSTLKRLARQLSHQTPMKSPKRLESLFKLDTVLTKAIESFNENDASSTNDTQLSSLEQTPAVEVVKTSELNDTDPIYPDLIDCNDSIDNIASELSSPAMRLLLVKELEGKIETVGDLAKLTELEVNRICIKAPKVQVVKRVLADYASKKNKREVTEMGKDVETTVDVEPTVNEEPIVNITMATITTANIETQTNNLTSETETQTSLILQRFSSTQTDIILTQQQASQTKESGSQSTEDIIKSCLKDRKDFVAKLDEQLEKSSKLKLAETLPVTDCTNLLLKKMTTADAKNILNSVIERESELQQNGPNSNKELSFLQSYLCDKFDAKDLILFCSQILQKVYDKGV